MNARPYATVARELGTTETRVIDNLARLRAAGIIKRIGPVFQPHRLGYTTFAALAVPPPYRRAAAAQVRRFPEIRHCFEREHQFNLWLAVTADHELRLRAVLRDIGRLTGVPVLTLPMIEDYPIPRRAGMVNTVPASRDTAVRDRLLAPATQPVIAAIRDGLPLVPRPFAALAAGIGISESDMLRRIWALRTEGTIKRWGVIADPRKLGFAANAMAVWNVPDDSVAAMGACLARIDFVARCGRRVRRLPDWPYNLYAFVYGRNRDAVITRIRSLVYYCGLERLAGEVLFECDSSAAGDTGGRDSFTVDRTR